MPSEDARVIATDAAAEPATVLSYLKAAPLRLYALLDAARKPSNVILLRESGDRHESLYSGQSAQELVNVAPYLVQLSQDSRVLEKLATEGWDDAWGYCVVSRCSFEELRTHIRKFLMVTTEDGREVYFRFYDPRVIRVFLPVSTLEQASRFFEKIDAILCPGATAATITSFRLTAGRVETRERAFGAPLHV